MMAIQTFRKIFHFHNMYPSKMPNEPHFAKNGLKMLLTTVTLNINMFPLWAYFFLEAKTFSEYAESFYSVSTITLVSSISLIFMYKRINVFQLIDDFEIIFQERKFSIYLNVR